MAFSQSNRRFTVSTPLDDDALVLRKLSGSEKLSGLFEFDLELHSNDIDIKHEDLLGENVTVGIELPDGEIRHLNGFVSQIAMEGYDDRHVVYRATLSPWFWFLTRTSDCRIFQEMTVPDIIKKVFNDHGFSDFQDLLTATYRTWEYCVQYRETDFNFISRLMEQEGIYYFFTHEDGKHNLVMADAPSAHETVSGYDTVPFFPPDDNGRRERDHLQSWKASKQIQPGSYALTDYDFKAPKKSLMASSEVPRDHTASEFEIYDYPGEYTESADGDHYVKARIQELQAQHEILQGDGDAAGLTTGAAFTLSDFPREDQNRKYLIISASYDLSSSGLEGGGDNQERFHISIQAMDAEQSYRAPRSTPKPAVQGVQTAVVVGPKGEEIHTDEFGRVKVQFHWDRYGEANENSSCWIRVAHIWAGKSWGGIHTPRIGQEVIVDFLEGDPDQPIITGRVYNKDNMPPYELPANKTQSGMKTRSSKGGDATNFNEIRFEDKKDSEEVYVHAEKDYNSHVENDQDTTVEHDQSNTIGNDQSNTIGNNQSTDVAVNQTNTIGGNQSTDVAKNQTNTVSGNRDTMVKGNHSESVDGNQMITVGKDLSVSIAKSETISIGKDLTESIEGKSTLAVTKEYAVKAKKITLIADDEIVFKTGSAQIIMKKNGDITLKGKNINVKGSGNVIIKGSKVTAN